MCAADLQESGSVPGGRDSIGTEPPLTQTFHINLPLIGLLSTEQDRSPADATREKGTDGSVYY